MAWIILLMAGILEIGWAVGLKYTNGFTRLWPSVATVSAMVLSMALLALAVRTLPLGTAYAVWTGDRHHGNRTPWYLALRRTRLVCSRLLCALDCGWYRRTETHHAPLTRNGFGTTFSFGFRKLLRARTPARRRGAIRTHPKPYSRLIKLAT
jgi:Small Multidrug Resistance protein